MMLDDPIFREFRRSVIPAWEEVFELFDDASEKAEIVEFAQWLLTKKSSAYETLRGVQYEREVKDLSDVTLSLVEDFKTDHKKMEFYQKIFRQYVIAGKELGLWAFDIPKAVILAPREKNPINPTRFNLLPKTKLWQEAFHAAVRDVNIEGDDGDLIWGQLILSAIFCGGLINSQLLIAFVKSILETERYHLGKRYLDLRPTWQGHEEVEYRRWFFDPLTELIAVKHQKKMRATDVSEISGTWIIKRVNKTLARHLSKQELPRGITDLLDAIGVRYSVRLPPFLVFYAQRKSLSHSLQVSAWERLSKAGTLTQEHGKVNLSQWQKTIKIDDSDETLSFFYDKKLAEIRDCLKTDRADIARRNLTLLMGDKEPTDYYYLLSDWLKTLLGKSDKGASLKVSTLRGYLSSIGRRLAEVFNEQSLSLMQAEELEDVYTVVLDSLESRGLRRKVAKVILQFHLFIADKYQVPEIQYHQTLGVSNSPIPVDANLIWVDEYYQILTFIEKSNLIEIHPDLSEIAQLLFTLGYRCGLRRMEALKLRIIDFQNGQKPHLIIRPHHERRLKTKNSQRLIPLYALLTEDELNCLERWKDKRVKQELHSSKSEYLFAIPSKNFDSVPQELVFPILHTAMRTVTGDENLRYHHLRHSFGSLTLLKLMASDYKAPLHFFEKMPKQKIEIEKSAEFRNLLLPVLGPSRKYLYAVGRLLGHSGPDISLEHYLHVLDLLLYQQMQFACSPSNELLMAASPLPASTSYRHLAYGADELIERVNKRYELVPDMNVSKGASKSLVTKDNANEDNLEQGDGLELNETWQMLYMYFEHNSSLKYLAERYKLNEKTVLTRIKQSKWLNVKNSLGQKISYPSKPIKTADVKVFKSLACAFSELRGEDEQTYQHGLIVYRDNYWVSEQQTVFKIKETAKEYLDFLRSLGLSQADVDLTILVGSQEVDENTCHQYWRSLNTRARAFEFSVERGKNNMKYGKYGFLRIKVINEKGLATPAYRFVLQLLLIKEGLVLAP